MVKIKALPLEERPRERLLRDGAEGLSFAELIAIVLSNGTQGKSVLNLAQELLERFQGLEGLLKASLVELMEIKGIGRAKALQLQAAFAIARRCIRPASIPYPLIDSPEKAYALAQAEIAHHPQEVLFVILRDVRSRLLHFESISVGTLSQVLVHPREVFFPAVKYKAHSFILAHNHPSGDPTPSKADLELTSALVHSSRVMGIDLADHLIVCRESYVSLRAKGYLGQAKVY